MEDARPEQIQVALFYRKPRETGNFSIEASFDRLLAEFPDQSPFVLRKHVSSYFSNGVLPRIRAVLEARNRQASVNHVTGDVNYLALGLPGARTVLTIHDCGFMDHPNPLARRVLKRYWLDLPVYRCAIVTAVSEATRRDILNYTACPPEKVRVVPTLIEKNFRAVQRPFDSSSPRILMIGLAPNKNFERQVQALQHLKCRLHIIGELQSQHRELLASTRIDYSSAGNLTQVEMQQAYADCDLLLFASTLEGFGMPILEAQTVGRPVVTSSISSMPEVAGDGACLVDPYDVVSIRAGVARVIRDERFRADLVSRGFSNIKRFSAQEVVRRYEAIYREILEVAGAGRS